MKKRITMILIICIAFAICLLKLWEKVDLLSEFSCSGNVNFHRDSSIMSLSTKLHIVGNRGIISLNGFIANENSERSIISRTISFKSESIGSRYTWVSEDVLPSIEDNISLTDSKKWLPDFYTQKHKKVELYLKRININSYMISGDFVPYYFCLKKH